jgi:hypothetical protein
MKMNHTDIPAVFAQFLDAAVIPKATGWQRFGAGAAAFVVQHRLPQIMEQYGPVMKMAGVLDEQGMIDIDLAHNLAAYAMEKSGKVNVAGYLVDSSDVEQIYQIARAYAR